MMILTRQARRGTALVLVLWITFALVVVAIYFAHSAKLGYQASDNSLAGFRADQAIAGSQRYLAYMLQNVATAGVMPSVDDGDYNAEAVEIGAAKFWILGRDENATSEPTEPTFGLVDEASKLNLNTATLEMLEALPNMTPEVAAAIVDWRDTDSEQEPHGAESQDYLLLDNPYLAKDSDFETVEELRFVKGVDVRLLYGEDTNRNGILDPNEDDGDESWPDDDSDGKLDPGLVEYLTTFTREPNTRADGSARINIQTPGTGQSLIQMLIDSVGADRAAQIAQVILPQRATIDSPLAFYLASGMTEAEFALVEDGLTAKSGDFAVGLVNVNTAPAAVLGCLPGMTEDLADSLIQSRTGLDAEAKKSITWITKVLPPETAKLVGPFVTTKSYQYSADVTAFGQSDRGFRRTLLVLDREDKTSLIFRRDMTRFGNPMANWDGWRTAAAN